MSFERLQIKQLFKRLMQMIAVLVVAVSAGAILLANFAEEFVATIFNVDSEVYSKSVMLMFGLAIALLVIGAVIWIVIFSYDKSKETQRLIQSDRDPQACREMQKTFNSFKEVAEVLSATVRVNEVADYVIADKKVDDLELSVSKGKQIIIFTSRFILEEKEEFSAIIIHNFRKGVKYMYYVPNDDLPLSRYNETVKKWFTMYSEFLRLNSADKVQAFLEQDVNSEWDNSYLEIINKYIEALSYNGTKKNTAIKNIEGKLHDSFKSLLKTVKHQASLFYVTVAMYEQDNGKNIDGTDWKAIIKLPTERPDEHFVAFLLDGANTDERKRFNETILKLQYSGEDYDFSDIFTG